MAYKKIDKEFCLTDESVNVYGYRLLTTGLALDRFKPAIGFLMHNREAGVAVKWSDFRSEGDKVYAKPSVNMTKFPELAQQIEDGFYAAASVGHIVALEVSDDPKDKIDGQSGPTVTRWFPRECSIVDIPGNYNALAQLYDETDGVLHDLTDNYSQHKTNTNMNAITFSAAELGLPNLTAETPVEEVQIVIADLVAKAARTDAAETELKNLKASVMANRVKSILAKGMADRKLTQALCDRLETDYASNPESLQALVDSMPAQSLITENFAGVPEKYAGKTFNDLYLSGELEEVKKNFPAYYEQLKNSK